MASVKETTNYGDVHLTTLRTIFGDEMTYNELALLVNDMYDLKVEIITNTTIEATGKLRYNPERLVSVWFDDKIVMDFKKYSTNYFYNMFYFLDEIEHTLEANNIKVKKVTKRRRDDHSDYETEEEDENEDEDKDEDA